jgi:murein DD-endopeptidase MepM/ murein hydrolase activator NlpD
VLGTDNLTVVPGRLVVAAVAVLLLALGGAAAAASSPAGASARAFGVRVVVPGGDGGSAAAVASPPQGSASLPSYSYGDGAVTTGELSTSSRTAAGSTSANGGASATVQAVSLFGGEVTADSVFAKASARATGRGASGTLATSSLSNVIVLGEAVDAAPNVRVDLADWGYAVLLEQAVVRRADRRFGHRGFVTGIHVVLTAEHGGLPAGSEIMIGYAEAAASAPKPAPAPQPQPQPQPGGSSGPPKEPVPSAPGAEPHPPPVVQTAPPDVKPALTAAGYVFPVYGPSSFSDDFAAARADTGWHHGNDVFAPVGAPILAVTDGTLFLVGWNDVGGNRLWLRDDQGNEFYYAHLSAYSPLAQDGARVRGGDVIGFVGATGDAVGTPPHLHFEIHPRELLWLGYDGVINPFPYLTAWRRLADIGFGAWTPLPGRAPRAGAVLLQAEDISTLSGLGKGSLAALLQPQELFGEAPVQPQIVGAEPGFSG